MKMFIIMILNFFALFALADGLQQDGPKQKAAVIRNAFIPAGFDSNDRAEVVVEGTLGGDCVKVGPTKYRIDSVNHVIELDQKVYDYPTDCHFILISYSRTVELGLLPPGNYSVIDRNSGKTLGALPVRVAKTTAPDDYLYAPVSDVQFYPESRKIVVQGNFSTTCMKLKTVVTKIDGDHVVVVLPIAEWTAGDCTNGNYPFTATTLLPAEFKDGEHYLIHVRSLNGQAINKTVNPPLY